MKKLTLFLIFTLLNYYGISQDTIMAECRLDASNLRNGIRLLPADTNIHAKLKTTYPSTAIVTCGKIDLYYEDMALQNGIGFDHPTDGVKRRNTICAVYNYLQTIYDFSQVSSTDHITVEIQQSYDLGNPPPLPIANVIASAGPIYPTTILSTQGIYAGNFFNHYKNGTSPSPTEFDATMRVNFIVGGSFCMHTDYTQVPITNCYYDLFTVALHEAGHQMGFLSLIKESTTTPYVPVRTFTVNSFTQYDWSFLYHGNINTPSSFNKLIIGSVASPSINNTVSTTNWMRDMQLWINNKQRFEGNMPVYSGVYIPSYPTNWYFAPYASDVTASHFCGTNMSWTQRFVHSPGMMKPWVMQPYSALGESRREQTLQDIRVFTTLNYSLNPTYAGSSSICTCTTTNGSIIGSNKYPYTTKQVTAIHEPNSSDQSYPDFGQVVDFTTTVGTPITINLAADTSLHDKDEDIIRVELNTLYNIRGCGNGGNNHNQLSLNSSSTQITYTPRTNFLGRAQFGFYLHDGKERGNFMVYTIDVLPSASFTNTPNSSTPTGSVEMVINGDFEEGSELKRTVSAAEEAIHGQDMFDFREEGQYFAGVGFADAHPIEYVNNIRSNNYGLIIGNSSKSCSVTSTLPYKYGSFLDDYTFPFSNMPTPVSGYRYALLKNNYHYNRIYPSTQKCHYYTLSMDINSQGTPWVAGNTYTLNFQLENAYTYTATTPLQTITYTVTPGAGWTNVSKSFFACPTTSVNYINLQGHFTGVGPYYDNVSLVENFNPPPLTLTATASSNSVCIGSNTVTLTASSTNSACSASYTWTPGNLSGPTVTVAPTTTTTYTVVMNDGCRTATATTTINVGTASPPVSITASSPTVCTGGSVTLTASGASSYTWDPGSVIGNLLLTVRLRPQPTRSPVY